MDSGLYQTYHRQYPFIIALLSLFAALFYNELNVHILRSVAPDRLEPKCEWVKTADDISYLRPAENYYLHGVWRDNNPGRQSYFLRTPGYGYFRYTLMEIFGVEDSYIYFRYVQLFIFAVSVLALFQIAILIGLPEKYALAMEAIYGLSPFASGFLYYSITEAISPALMIFYIFFLLLAYVRSKPSYFLLAALVMGYTGLTRPVLLLFGIALPISILWGRIPFSFSKKVAFVLLTGFIALEPISMWAIRSARIADGYVSIYPIYYIENNSQFRPAHAAIWDFEKSYGTEGLDFHQCMVPLWHATIAGDTSGIHVDSIMMACPDFVKQAIGEQRLRNSYIHYRQSITYQRSHYPREIAMPDTVPAIEQQVVRDFHTYTAEINSKHWFWCHIIVPLKLFKSLSFHSNLSLYMFQHTYRGRWWMEALRILFLVLHFLCCLSFIPLLLLSHDRVIRYLFGITILLYFFYLCYFFRGLEERYTLPLLPLMLVCLFYSVNLFIQEKICEKPKTLHG
jgi:hypothetical protein